MNVTLTVPFAGMDLTVSGSPLNIAKVAMIVEQGLPTLADMNISPELAALCEASGGDTSMGMGDGSGQEFITGSHMLISAVRHAMMRTSPDAGFDIMGITSRPYGTGSRRIEANIMDSRGRQRAVTAFGGRAEMLAQPLVRS